MSDSHTPSADRIRQRAKLYQRKGRAGDAILCYILASQVKTFRFGEVVRRS